MVAVVLGKAQEEAVMGDRHTRGDGRGEAGYDLHVALRAECGVSVALRRGQCRCCGQCGLAADQSARHHGQQRRVSFFIDDVSEP